MRPPPEQVFVDGVEFTVDRERWSEGPVASQPGDGTHPKPFPLDWYSGFGFTNINTNSAGARQGATYHGYAHNMDLRRPGLFGPSSKISYINMADSVGASGRRGFRLGGYTNSQLGGGFQSETTEWIPFTVATSVPAPATVPWVSPTGALPVQVVGTSSIVTFDSSTSFSITPHADTQVGDLVVVFVEATSQFTITAPSGFTASEPAITSDPRSGVYYGTLESVGALDFSFVLGESGRAVAVTVRGHDPDTAPIFGAWGNLSTGASADVVAPTVTSTEDNSLLLAFWAFATTTVPVLTITAPASMTQLASSASTTGSLAVASEALSAAGATGTRTATLSSATLPLTVRRSVLMAISPAPYAAADGTDETTDTLTLTVPAATRVPAGATIGSVDVRLSRMAVNTNPIAFGSYGARTAIVDRAQPFDLPISAPTVVAAGDLLLAEVVSSNSPLPTITPPAGWTLVTGATSGTGFRGAIYRKIATDAEPGSYTFAISGSGATYSAWGRIVSVVGFDATAPIDAFSTMSHSAASPASAASVTTTVDGCLVLTFFSAMAASGPTWSTPTGSTEQVDSVGGEVSTYTQSTAGATGTKDSTPSSAVQYFTVQVAVRPGTAIVLDANARILSGGAATGPNKANAVAWDDAWETITYSWTSAQLSDAGITASVINAASFGFALSALITSGEARVAHVEFRVTHVDAVAGGGQLGGGSYVETPQAITEYGDTNLYVHCGSRTFRLDMDAAAPSVAEVRYHGADARARSSAVFDNQMVVPLGAGEDVTVATTPGTAVSATTWETATGVRMEVAATGSGGRLFTSFVNRVYNILPGLSPLVAANYTPSVGEAISDETDPVRSLAEYMRGLVAGTVRGLRTFDPDAGYQGRALVNPIRFTGTQYDGKSLLMIGDDLLFFTRRVVWLFRAGQRPVRTGPELLDQNEGPWRGLEWGVPDYTGDFIIVPAYKPATGDSVIFALRPRADSDPGIGPMQWSDWLYLEGQECRVVRFWGGTEDYGPKVVFGADTETVGWVGVGVCGAPDLFCTMITFATYSKAVGGWDDLGTPGVRKEFDRIELPVVENADANNYLRFSISPETGEAFTALPIVSEDGFVKVLPAASDDLIGRAPALMLEMWQEIGQDHALVIKGTPWVYYSEVPDTVQQIETYFKTKLTRLKDGQQEAERLMAHTAGQRVQMKHAPGNDAYEARIISCQAVVNEVNSAGGDNKDTTISLKTTWRVVPTSG